MPAFAYVQVRQLVCPKCFRDLISGNLVGFQWGYCHGVSAAGDYQIGDAIKWRVDRQGLAYEWSYFKHGDGNIGNPNYFNLLIRESEFELRNCRSCNYQFAGIGIGIEGGIIKDVRVYAAGLPDADISIVNDDGSLTAMPAWDDHPMRIIANAGWLSHLVPQTDFPQPN